VRLISTSVRGYCWGFAFYTDPNRNPVLGFQIARDHVLLILGRNRDKIWKR
jgi:hypothetical protein